MSVEDRLELYELMARYAAVIDGEAPPEELMAIFSDDVVLESAITGRFSGPEGLRQWAEEVAELRSKIRFRHFITNVRVAIEGDRATVRSYLLGTATHRPPIPQHTEARTEVSWAGSYAFEARKIAGRWRLSKRALFIDASELERELEKGKTEP